MGVGLGILLLLAGLILAVDVVNVGTPFVDEGPLGWILIAVGALAILLGLVTSRQQATTRHVETRVQERRDQT